MLDTMTFTKVLGSLCGALLVFLLGGWFSETIFYGGGGHGYEAEQAYLIETDDAGSEEVIEGGEEIDFVALVAEADPADGEKAFGKCRACHKMDGTDGTGPHLNGVVGRQIASVGGFAYSDALHAHDQDVWDADHLNAFLEDPKGWAPGTKMAFAGIRRIDERADLVAYLQSVQ